MLNLLVAASKLSLILLVVKKLLANASKYAFNKMACWHNGCQSPSLSLPIITSSYHKLIIDHPIVDQPHNQDDIALLIAMVMILAAATGTVFFKLYVIDEPPNPNISTFRPLPMQVEPFGALLEIFCLNLIDMAVNCKNQFFCKKKFRSMMGLCTAESGENYKEGMKLMRKEVINKIFTSFIEE